MRFVPAFEPGIGHISQAVADARRAMSAGGIPRAYLIFNEVPLPIEADNDAEIDEVWRRHMQLREDARRGRQ